MASSSVNIKCYIKEKKDEYRIGGSADWSSSHESTDERIGSYMPDKVMDRARDLAWDRNSRED